MANYNDTFDEEFLRFLDTAPVIFVMLFVLSVSGAAGVFYGFLWLIGRG